MFFQNSIAAVQAVLSEYESKQSLTAEQTPEYILWMCEQIEAMNENDIAAANKANRWAGWIFAAMENLSMINWNNTDSRDVARKDRQAGLDRPHCLRQKDLYP